MEGRKVIIIDLETGGFDEKVNPITQIAYEILDLDSLTVIDSYNEYIRPYKIDGKDPVLEQNALNVSKITLELLNKKGIDIEVALKQLIKDCERVNPNNRKSKFFSLNAPILCAHNVAFEEKMLVYNYKLINEDFNFFINSAKWDTQHFAEARHPKDNKKVNLNACRDKEDMPYEDAHNAMRDVEMTRELLVKWILLLRNSHVDNFEEKITNSKKRTRSSFKFEI